MAEIKEVRVPDIGDVDGVTVVEVIVKAGDEVAIDDSLIALESDKASMEVPSPLAGRVKEIKVEVGDEVAEGELILTLETWAMPAAAAEKAAVEAPQTEPAKAAAPEPPAKIEDPPPAPPATVRPPAPRTERLAGPVDELSFRRAYASPAVRRLARQLGVDLGRVAGSGRSGRITKDDVRLFVKTTLAQPPAFPGAVSGFAWPQLPEIDYARFGPVEALPLGRIRQLTAHHVHRSWLHIPQVTQHDEADVTELEAFRQAQAGEAKRRGFKLTPVAFLLKAAAGTLKELPEFNASLDPSGQNLILKRYFHIGVAVETPKGLLVPVIRDVDRKGVFELAAELQEVSGRAREGKLLPQDFQGGCFTVSSLGGIGGTAFTPIVNAPEVAILGVSRHAQKPVWRDGAFVPRLMLPLSLSYDHRVIDGAAAARFVVYLSGLLSEIRRLLL